MPADLVERLGQARVLITNYHAFMLHERGDAAKLTKAILTKGAPSPFTETLDQMVRRVCRELGTKKQMPADDDRPRGEVEAQRDDAAGQFETMILDNLRKAGVQNTVKGERLVFDRLEALGGTWLQAAGAYADADGKVRRVAVSIGPEHGTVGRRR